MVGAERAGRRTEPVATGKRLLWLGHLQPEPWGAGWSPSEARRAQTQPCSHLGRKKPRPATMHETCQDPDDPTWSEPSSPCTRDQTPAQGHTLVPPRGSTPRKTADRLRIYPQETKSRKRLDKLEKAHISSIFKFRFSYPQPPFPTPSEARPLSSSMK